MNAMDLQRARAEVTTRLSKGPTIRIVAFGSSNTERAAHSAGQYNWFDWLGGGLMQERLDALEQQTR